MSSFLKSRRRRVLASLAVLFLAAFLLEASISRKLSESKTKITDYLSRATGARVTLDNAGFGFLKGVHLSGLSIFYGGQGRAIMSFKGISLRLDLLQSLLRNRVVFGRVNVSECVLLSKKEEEGMLPQIIFSDLGKALSRPMPGALLIYSGDLTINAGAVKIIPVDEEFNPGPASLRLKNMRVSLRPNGKVTGKGYAGINFKSIEQGLKYSLEARISKNNLEINNITLWLQDEQIIGQGIIRDFFERRPYMDLWLMASMLSLKDIAFINENFQAQGFISASLIISGPPDDTRLFFKGNAYDCNVEYPLAEGQTLSLKDIKGSIEFKEPFLNLRNMSLKIGNLPLNLGLKINLKEEALSLNVSLSNDFLAAQNLPIRNLGAVLNAKLGGEFTGELEINADYLRSEELLAMHGRFKGLRLGRLSGQEYYLKASGLTLSMEDRGQTQKADFSDFESKVELGKKRINITNIILQGYDGSFMGSSDIGLKDKASFSFFLRGRGLDIVKLTQDLRLTGKFLSGKLDTKLKFDNHAKEFFQGDCYVSQASIDLSALAEAVKVPPLGNMNFKIAHIYFTVTKERVKIRAIKLSSPDIKLNAYWDIKKTMAGALNAKISSSLLNNSPQFKKLLSLAGITNPYIDFRFLLGGTPQRIRLMWMKGEFKEKLEKQTSAGIKKRIEKGLDKMIDELSNR